MYARELTVRKDIDAMIQVEQACHGEEAWVADDYKILPSGLSKIIGLEEVVCERDVPDEYLLLAYQVLIMVPGSSTAKMIAFPQVSGLSDRQLTTLTKATLLHSGCDKIYATPLVSNLKMCNMLKKAGFLCVKEENGNYTFEAKSSTGKPAMTLENRLDKFL